MNKKAKTKALILLSISFWSIWMLAAFGGIEFKALPDITNFKDAIVFVWVIITFIAVSVVMFLNFSKNSK